MIFKRKINQMRLRDLPDKRFFTHKGRRWQKRREWEADDICVVSPVNEMGIAQHSIECYLPGKTKIDWP